MSRRASSRSTSRVGRMVRHARNHRPGPGAPAARGSHDRRPRRPRRRRHRRHLPRAHLAGGPVVSTHTWDLRTGYPIPDAEHLHHLCKRGMPRRLFGAGARADAFDHPRVAIVGTRAATPPGLADARDIGAFCARAGLTVVSGLALGIDGAAHEGALDAGGLTVGVVATGLDIVYPRQHTRLFARVREQGLIVTENAYGTQPLPWRFPIRNRIIAALSDAVVVVEATIE